MAVVLGGALAIDRMRPLPQSWPFPINVLTGTASPDCRLPCWHGITPGLSTRADAEALMEADPHYGRVDIPFGNTDSPRLIYRWMATVTEDNTARILNADDFTVTDIEISGTLSPAQALLGLGPPTAYRFQCGDLEFHYAGMQLTFFWHGQSVSFNDMSAAWESAAFLILDSGTDDADLQPWRGFTTRFLSQPKPCD